VDCAATVDAAETTMNSPAAATLATRRGARES